MSIFQVTGRIALVGSLGLIAGGCATTPGVFQSKCGSAVHNHTFTSTAMICVSFCGPGSSQVSCNVPGADAPRTPEQPPMGQIEEVKLAIVGHGARVADVASSFRAASGWTVVIDGVEGTAPVKAVKWEGTWSQFGGFTLRTESGARVALTADAAKQRIELRPGT